MSMWTNCPSNPSDFLGLPLTFRLFRKPSSTGVSEFAHQTSLDWRLAIGNLLGTASPSSLSQSLHIRCVRIQWAVNAEP